MLGRGMKDSGTPVVPTRSGEDRFDRSKRIPWFDLDLTRRAQVLVVGAGALGNEVVKDLVLAGVRRITLVDMDHVVRSNLNRCVFFTPEDARAGRPKVDAVAEGAARLDPSVEITTEAHRIRRFLLLYKELDPDDGELTRTRKVRRGVINERYADIIDAIYDGRDTVHVDAMITFQDGTRSRIVTDLRVETVLPAEAGAGTRQAAE